MPRTFKVFLTCFLLTGIALIVSTTGCENPDETISNGVEEVENAAGHHEGSSISIVSFGNPNVAHAVEDPEVQIKGLHINGRSGLSYSWAKNNLSQWGLANDNAGALAVAGYQDGDHFVCAKFDWISSSRRTRDFVNINSGYNGWQPERFYAAKKRCFFIMSSNGKKRTNIITD